MSLNTINGVNEDLSSLYDYLSSLSIIEKDIIKEQIELGQVSEELLQELGDDANARLEVISGKLKKIKANLNYSEEEFKEAIREYFLKKDLEIIKIEEKFTKNILKFQEDILSIIEPKKEPKEDIIKGINPEIEPKKEPKEEPKIKK